MSNSVHGHDVLNFMLEKGGGFSKESLKAAIIARFWCRYPLPHMQRARNDCRGTD